MWMKRSSQVVVNPGWAERAWSSRGNHISSEHLGFAKYSQALHTSGVLTCDLPSQEPSQSYCEFCPTLFCKEKGYVNRRTGMHAGIKWIWSWVLSRVYTQFRFSAFWSQPKSRAEITTPWILVLLVHDTLRWSQACTKDCFIHGMLLQQKGLVRIQDWMRHY